MATSAPLQSISIPRTENRTLPTPHIVYAILVTLPVKSWFIFRRYSEFVTLHQNFISSARFGGSPPAALPPKHVARTTLKAITGLGGLMPKGEAARQTEEEQLSERKDGLEKYLRAILASPDDRWRESDEFKEFIELPRGQSTSAALGTNGTASAGKSGENSYTSRRYMPGSLPSSTEGGVGSFTRTLGTKPKEPAKETDATRTLDDRGLMTSQQAQMDTQDRQLEGLAAILRRQKAMGLAINQELSEQTELLDELDGQVDQTQGKMRQADKKMDKLK
ncbi:endosomal t-SNARE [Meira miltonrushii]|uniref:Endosomal t-SNARE n=1 Tax=Meira miltonrushii TaxID=1280837 RepID=A0A316VDM6_9BASI|nr:endosomal t-SNARE [Meira miltonrushii]PWN34373.1 endosomal t-SNARE [Meira miltonrushii]